MTTIIRLDEVDSTQRVARELAEGGAGHGSWVLARRQTAGRGRLGRAWVPPDEGLYASVVLRPNCAPALAPRLTFGAAVAVVRALDDVGVPSLVKWPNDVVIRAAPSEPRPPRPPLPQTGEGAAVLEGRLGPYRKVSGLLVEVVRMRELLEVCVLGVGVNVRAPAAGWPEDIARTAGALADAGFTGTVDDVFTALRARLEPSLHEALTAFDRTLDVLRARSATLGRRVTLDEDPREGLATRLLQDGALLVVDDDGGEHVVRAGDVWLG